MELISAGSSLKFCLLAEGSADLYPRLGPTMEWDTAAGQIIVEEAGGRVTGLDAGPLDLAAPSIVATNGRIHDAVLAKIRETRSR